MSIFAWLVIGHLVGDWMLQTDWMAREKQNGLVARALLIHCLIYTGTLMATLALVAARHALSPPYLSVGLIVLLSHWLIDGARLAARWSQLLRQTKQTFVRIMVDQTLHLLVLAFVIEFLF